MKTSIDCLNPEQLHLMLRGELPPAQLAAIEAHLSQCEDCRAKIDHASGDTQWWSEARESLRPTEADPAANTSADTAYDDVLHLLGPTDDPRMLGRIATYEIAGILGRGGMGVVFKGLDSALNRYVAIKMLLPHLAASGAARKRFAREAQAAAAVVDDHVMPIHNVAEWQGVPYLVMPYTRGVSLQRRLNDRGPLDLREILRIGMQTARALAAAHAQGLVHRDVKPANIMLAEGVERVTLTDFGLARAADDATLTRTGTLAGTPQYMSPEQVRGHADDARSDLFSLGSVLYAASTGRAPFRAQSSYGVLRMITDDAPKPIREINPDIPIWLSAIIEKLMAKKPEDRFASAKEVADLLEACLAHVQQPTKTPLPPALAPACRSNCKLSKRIWIMTTALLAIALAIAAFQKAAPTDKVVTPAPNPIAAVIPAEAPTPQQLLRFNTRGSVNVIAMSADGLLVAVATDLPVSNKPVEQKGRPLNSAGVEIFDPATGKSVVILQLTTKDEDAILAKSRRDPYFEIKALAFSPDGKMLAVGTSVGQVKIFNSQTGGLLQSLDDEAGKKVKGKPDDAFANLPRAIGSANSVAFSPDGTQLAICGGSFKEVPMIPDLIERGGLRRGISGPGHLEIWDLKTGELKQNLVGHANDAQQVAFSPDGKLLASMGNWSGADGEGRGARIWDAATGQLKRRIDIQDNGGPTSVAFSPDSKLIAISGLRFNKDDDTRSGSITVVHAGTGIMEWSAVNPGWIRPVAFLPDGKTLIALGDSGFKLLEVNTGKTTSQIPMDHADLRWHCFAIAAQAHVLATGGIDRQKKGSVEIWKF